MTETELRNIAAAVQIIDIACQRGAIRGEEMSDVGGVRNGLLEILKPRKDVEQPEDDSE